jgi:hypothetical protein
LDPALASAQPRKGLRCALVAVGIALAAAASPARGELNAHYRGVDRTTGTEAPVTVRLSIAPGRVAFIVQGSREARILFREDTDTLRFVDDTGKSYFEIGRCASGDSGMTSGIEGQLSQLTPEQRQMAEGLIHESLDQDQALQPFQYVRTKVKRQVLAYECSVVEIKEGDEKFADYCGCKSKEFKLGDAEVASLRALQRCLVNLTAAMTPTESAAVRALQWDAEAGGFPLQLRCFVDGNAVLDVTMDSFDRKKPAEDPFLLPAGYTKAEVSYPPDSDE